MNDKKYKIITEEEEKQALEYSRKMLQENKDKQERVKLCWKEINESLDKNQCSLDPYVVVSQKGTKAGLDIVPK